MNSLTRFIRARFHGRAAGKQRSRGFTLSVGFAAVAIAMAMFYVGYHAPQSVPGRSYYNLHALFRNADNLEDHYDVRIGGVRAGQVLNPRVKNHLAEVDLQLSSAFKPLRSDSTIRIRLRSAVGIRYVEITPGTRGTPLPDGATLGLSQTSAPVDLDQVLRTFDPQTRATTAQFLGELGNGVAARGQDVNETLGDAPGFLSKLGSVSGAINSRPGAMSSFISSSQGAAAAFDPVRDVMSNGFQPETQALKPFSDRASELHATLEQAPPTLAELQSGLPSVTALVAQVTGLARAARPTLADAPAAFNQTTALLEHARPGLRGADKTLQLAHQAVSPALTFLRTAQPALPMINKALRSSTPIVTDLAAHTCGLSDGFAGWAGTMKFGTAYNNQIRFTIADTSTIVAGQPNAPSLASPYIPPCNGTSGSEVGGPKLTPEQMVAAK
jgi:virulence factor Mce-like protein